MARMAMLVLLAAIGLVASQGAEPCKVEACAKCIGTEGFGGWLVGVAADPLVCQTKCLENAANTHYTAYTTANPDNAAESWCRCYVGCESTMMPTDHTGTIYKIGCGDEAGIVCPDSSALCAALPTSLDYSVTATDGDTVSCNPPSGSAANLGVNLVQCIASAVVGPDAICNFTILITAQQNCVPSDFSDWSSCTQPCGGGTRQRSRTVATPANDCGAPCGPLVETEECNTEDCDCLTVPCAKCVGTEDFGGWLAGVAEDPLVCEMKCRENATNTHYTAYATANPEAPAESWCRCYASCGTTMLPDDHSGTVYTINCPMPQSRKFDVQQTETSPAGVRLSGSVASALAGLFVVVAVVAVAVRRVRHVETETESAC